LLVAALILPVIVLAGAMIIQAYRNERAGVAHALLSTSRAVAGVVDAKLANSESILTALANSDALARDDLIALDDHARQAVTESGTWFVLLDLDGQQRVNTRLPRGTALPRVEIDAPTRQATESGQSFVSDLKVSRATGEKVVHIVQPYFRHGRLTYLISITLTTDALAHGIDVQRYAPGMIVTLVDRTGIIIARSRNSQQFVGGPATADMVIATRTRNESIVDSVTLEHIPVVVAFSHARCGWATLIGAPHSDLYASARRLLILGAAGAILLILVAVAMAAWIGQALVHSADVLESEAASLGRGEVLPEVSTGLDESDFVANAMRRTAATLLRRTRTLEVLNRINATLVAERDLQRIVESVTKAGRDLSGAEFAALLYFQSDGPDNRLHLCATSGDDGSTRHEVFDPGETVLPGEVTLRVTDILHDPEQVALRKLVERVSQGRPYRSCLAVPVKTRTGEVIGWLVLTHAEAGVFSEEAEHVVVGLTAEAAIALDNAKLYHALARELEAKSKAEAELRVAQESLREHARELERKVDERTASLRDAVAQMEEFSYTVSHDLRGPLRAMHAFAEALIEDYAAQLDDTARDYLRRIQRASIRMDQLTTNLLSYSRVARTDVQLQPVDVERLVRGTIEHYADLQSPHADVQVISPLLPVRGHEPSLTQCLANLLTNAAKFVKPGEKPRITVRTEQRGDRVRIWVEDQGIGVPPAYQKGLFKIFERVPNKDKYEGTGVGLAIVRKATEKMGGTCGMDSDGVTGSRFWIELAAHPA
jgi:signal transduction histidine kinase